MWIPAMPVPNVMPGTEDSPHAAKAASTAPSSRDIVVGAVGCGDGNTTPVSDDVYQCQAHLSEITIALN